MLPWNGSQRAETASLPMHAERRQICAGKSNPYWLRVVRPVRWSTVPPGLVLVTSRLRLGGSGSLDKPWGLSRFYGFWEKGVWARSTKRSTLASTAR